MYSGYMLIGRTLRR